MITDQKDLFDGRTEVQREISRRASERLGGDPDLSGLPMFDPAEIEARATVQENIFKGES